MELSDEKIEKFINWINHPDEIAIILENFTEEDLVILMNSLERLLSQLDITSIARMNKEDE